MQWIVWSVCVASTFVLAKFLDVMLLEFQVEVTISQLLRKEKDSKIDSKVGVNSIAVSPWKREKWSLCSILYSNKGVKQGGALKERVIF